MDPSANGSVAPAVGKMIKKERSEKRRSSHRRKKSKSNSLEKDAFQVQKEVHEQEKERLKDTERKKSEKKKSDGEIKGKADKKSLDKGRERSKEKCKKEESDAQGEDKQKSIDKENEKEIGPVEIKGDAFALEEEEAPPEPELTERQRISVARSSVSKRLNLAAQSLRSIPSPVFDVTTLQHLDFSSNHLKSLSGISSLQCLESVNVSCNNFSRIPSELQSISALQVLVIRSNNIESLPDSLPEHLTKLDIAYNSVTELPLYISELKELKQLDVTNNGLTKLCPMPASLQVLKCDNNEISELSCLARSSALQELHLVRNNLELLPEIPHLTNLTILKLSENRITEMPSSLGELASVVFLRLRDIAFVRAFTDILPQQIELRSNILSEMPNSIGNLVRLTRLDLSDNLLSSVPDSIFDCVKLESLNLSCNRLSELPTGLRALTLKEFSIGSNQLKEIPPEVFELKTLTHLLLGYNKIRNVPPEIAALTRLRVLFLSDNKISKLPPDIGTMNSLRQLNVAYNKLSSVPKTMEQLRCLESVDLRGNRIKKVPKVLWNLQTMEMLDLSHNEQVINLPDQRSEMLEVEVLGTAMQEERLGRFKVGRAAMRGRRFNMEDALVVRPRYRGRLEEDFYAVFDGHGGSEAAEVAGKKMHKMLAKKIHACKHKNGTFDEFIAEVPQILTELFQEVNAKMDYQNIARSGTTAVIAYICKDQLFLAHVGDSRAVLVRGDGKAQRLTQDHRPLDPPEEQRIRNLGGCVTRDGRVNGSLAIARALGDVDIQPFVSHVPDVSMVTITPDMTHLVLGCDGVWDVVTDQRAAELVAQFGEPEHASAALRDHAFMLSSQDNISVIIVQLNPQRVLPQDPAT